MPVQRDDPGTCLGPAHGQDRDLLVDSTTLAILVQVGHHVLNVIRSFGLWRASCRLKRIEGEGGGVDTKIRCTVDISSGG